MTDDQQATMGDGPADASAYHGRADVEGSTSGVYMVLSAALPTPNKVEEPGPLSFEEVGYYRGAVKEDSKGGQAMTAKRNAFLDPENRRLRTAAEGGGIVLRAVPAQSWPAEVEPTRYTRPAPTLEIH